MASTGKRSGAQARRWSKEEYHRLGALGFFRGQRAELLEGQVVVQSPQGARHFTVMDQIRALLEGYFGAGYLVRMQGPIDLGQTSEPEPDLAVVRGARSQFVQSHPSQAVLLVEVSDTTVSYDRRRKGSLYARAGIEDYWIVNLTRNHIEVYRDPIPDPGRRYGSRYATRTDRMPGNSVTPLALPGVAIAVADLLV